MKTFSFKILPLVSLLAMCKKEIDEATAPLRARRVRAQAEMRLIESDSKLIELETKIQAELSSENMDFDKVAELMDEFDLATRRKEQLNYIVSSLFPEAKATAKTARSA